MRAAKALVLGLLASSACLAAPAFAAPVYSANFDAIVTSALKTPPSGWQPVAGNVDHVRSGEFGITCAGGSTGCVDLTGTDTTNPTYIVSNPISLAAGTYQLSFDISGNQRQGSALDTYYYRALSTAPGTTNDLTQYFWNAGQVVGSAGFTTVTSALFTLNSARDVYLQFGADSQFANIGPLLDNVTITAVPLPAAAWLLLSGLGGVAAFARRRRSGAVAA